MSMSLKPQFEGLFMWIFDTNPIRWREAGLCPRPPKNFFCNIQEIFKQTETSCSTRRACVFLRKKNFDFEKNQKVNRRYDRLLCVDRLNFQVLCNCYSFVGYKQWKTCDAAAFIYKGKRINSAVYIDINISDVV